MVSFVLQHVEGIDETRPRFAWFDDIIDVATLGSFVWIGKLFTIILY